MRTESKKRRTVVYVVKLLSQLSFVVVLKSVRPRDQQDTLA